LILDGADTIRDGNGGRMRPEPRGDRQIGKILRIFENAEKAVGAI
jgi:hypothetical protein